MRRFEVSESKDRGTRCDNDDKAELEVSKDRCPPVGSTHILEGTVVTERGNSFLYSEPRGSPLPEASKVVHYALTNQCRGGLQPLLPQRNKRPADFYYFEKEITLSSTAGASLERSTKSHALPTPENFSSQPPPHSPFHHQLPATIFLSFTFLYHHAETQKAFSILESKLAHAGLSDSAYVAGLPHRCKRRLSSSDPAACSSFPSYIHPSLLIIHPSFSPRHGILIVIVIVIVIIIIIASLVRKSLSHQPYSDATKSLLRAQHKRCRS